MVLLTLTATGKAAIIEYCKREKLNNNDDERYERLANIEPGNPIDHNELVEISKFLVGSNREDGNEVVLAKKWRLDTLLKGALVYRPPPAPKPEPVSLLNIF